MNKPRMEIIDNGYKPERSFVIQGYECKICEMKFVFWRDMREHLIEEHEESVEQVSFIPLIRYAPARRATA
jgi:hypothetical protein